eukprot:768281-Hanusia_phi.AAC.6
MSPRPPRSPPRLPRGKLRHASPAAAPGPCPAPLRRQKARGHLSSSSSRTLKFSILMLPLYSLLGQSLPAVLWGNIESPWQTFGTSSEAGRGRRM